MHEKDFKILALQARLKAAYTHLHALTVDEDLHDANCSGECNCDYRDYINEQCICNKTGCDCINRDIKEAIDFLGANTNDINQLTIPTYDI